MITQDAFLRDLSSIEIRPETKEKIIAIIDTEGFTLDSRIKIADMIQADIDADFAEEEVTIDPNDPEAKALVEAFNADMDAIEEDLADSMDFVEKTTNELNGAVDMLDKGLTDKRIADIKADL